MEVAGEGGDGGGVVGAADADGVAPTATISDPNWTLVEETTAGFPFSYNAAVPIAAGGGLTSMIEVGVYQFTQMTQPLNLTASIPGAAGGETDTSNNSTTTTLQPTYVPTPDLIIAATSPSTTFTQGSSVVVTYTVTNQGDRATYGVNGPITVYTQLPPDCTVDTSALPSGWTVTTPPITKLFSRRPTNLRPLARLTSC